MLLHDVFFLFEGCRLNHNESAEVHYYKKRSMYENKYFFNRILDAQCTLTSRLCFVYCFKIETF